MKEENRKPKRLVSFWINQKEYSEAYKRYKATTCSTLSAYLRKILLQKPVVIEYRDDASREMLAALNQITRDLSVIRSNFSRTVHKLHQLEQYQEIKMWAELTEASRQICLTKMESILTDIHKIYDQCIQR